MFKLKNIYSKFSLQVEVSYNGQSIEFLINSIISKRRKDKLNELQQFQLLNAYCDYKGDGFKKELFARYIFVEQDIMINISNTEIHPLPLAPFHAIMDMFDMMDVYHFISVVYGVKAPPSLADTFDESYEADGRGSRVQTYLKTDYLELAAVVVVVKAILGPLGHYAYIKDKQLSQTHRDYILYNFISSHHIGKLPAIEKLLGSIEKLMQMPDINTADSEAIRVIEKRLAKSEYPYYLLAIVVLQKVSIAVIVNDTDEENIVTSNYNYVKNKLRPNGDASKTIKNTVAMTSDTDGGVEDKESILEATRASSKNFIAASIELNWAMEDRDSLIQSLPVTLDKDAVNDNTIFMDPAVLADSVEFTKAFYDVEIDRVQTIILDYIFKTLKDPRSTDMLDVDSLVNLLGVGFAYLWCAGFKHIALILVARKDIYSQDTMSINITVNKNRIPKEVKETLNKLFPYNRVVNEHKSANVVEDMINDLGNEIFSNKYNTVAYDKYVDEASEPGMVSRILPPSLKIQLSEMIINHELLINNLKGK